MHNILWTFVLKVPDTIYFIIIPGTLQKNYDLRNIINERL